MDQFETIRIVEPGSYELNLMNLYEEDEKIIALQEDGRYQVSLPSTFDD
jgi:predicted  nucleic acid-binding Zn-ribbon protein